MSDPELFHIVPRDDWQAAQRAGLYRPASLGTEGFVHCSRREQVLRTANRFYRGRRDLILLCIDPARLAPGVVRDEPADGELFPHVYAPLAPGVVRAALEFPPDDATGAFAALPAGL